MNEDWLSAYEAKHSTPAKRVSDTKIVSSSYREIDIATGIGGFPLGKVIEIAGEPCIGKTRFAMDFIAFAQQEHLACVYLDLDRAFDTDYARVWNVDLDDLLIFRPENVEGIVPACQSLMKEGLADVIIFDSISNLPLVNDNEQIALKTVINPLLQQLREYNTSLLFISQIRKDLVEGGNITPRNEALNDLCNMRMMFNFKHVIKHQEVVIGHQIEIDIYKNELASPAKTEIELFV